MTGIRAGGAARVVRTGAAIAWLALGAGCLKLESEVTIKEDGGGACQVLYTLSEQAVNQVRAMLTLGDQIARIGPATPATDANPSHRVFLDPTEEGLRRELTPYEAQGVTIQELKVESRAGNRSVTLRLAFRNLAALQSTPLFRTFGFSLTPLPQADTYRFERSNPHPGWDPFPEALRDPATQKSLVPVMGGFNVQLRLRVPGRILESNAPRRAGDTATWVFDFDRDVYALPRLQTAQLVTVFTRPNLKLPEVRQAPVQPPAAPPPAL